MPSLPETSQETTPETPWPLSHFSAKLKAHVDRVPPTWVEGQLVEVNMRRGTAWMQLRDLEQEVSYSSVAWPRIAAGFEGTVQPGSRVVAQVKPSIWEKSGRLSLEVRSLQPVGVGDLLARVERLRRELTAEGLFSPERKRRLPVLPRRIGLITGRSSDAMKDVLRNVHARWAAAEFEIREVAVQGQTAPAAVAAALAELDALDDVDVIVIARGGGALEEVVLPFSDEGLIRAVAAARTPVVSAIGHEADRPLLDDVADVRASTPTGSAKLLVVEESEERQRLTEARTRMSTGVQRLVQREEEFLRTVRSRPALARPEEMITHRAEELLGLRRRALVSAEGSVERARGWVQQTRARVTGLSPQSTLDRGYAVVQTADETPRRIVRDAAVLAPGSAVQVMVASGEFGAEVTAVTAEKTTTDGGDHG